MIKELNDIQLVARVAVFNDKRAFDALVRKYQEQIRRFFLSQTLGDRQLSDDLAQDTFVKAYVGIAGFRNVSGFSTWLYRIACNVLIDYRRRHKVSAEITPTVENRKGASADGGLKMDLYGGMEILRDDERLCLTLQLVDGLAVDDIVKVTGMPLGTVKSHLSRGKHKLANYLKENGYDR